MKICYLSDASNYHTQKWARWFANRGHEVFVISFTYGLIEGVKVCYIDSGATIKDSDVSKLKYLTKIRAIRRLIDDINPDIVHAHYASSYGSVLALSGYNNYILSVWGSDIYDFPKKSILHKLLIKLSLTKPNVIFSTSKAMANEAKKYTNIEPYITPFGVDMKMFNPSKKYLNEKLDSSRPRFVVGTIKKLEDKYGIRYILEAAKIIKDNYPEIPIEIRIAGKGKQELEYRELASNLGISNIITWLGFISQEEAALEWANFDLAVIPSIYDSESFGVSAVEAQASGTPLIVSDIPGLLETVIPGETCLVIPRANSGALAKAIYSMYIDNRYRRKMGKAGRDYVITKFDLDKCFLYVENIYKELITRHN